MTKPFIYSFPRSGLHLTCAVMGKEPLINFRRMQDPLWVKQQISENDNSILFLHKTRAATDNDLFTYIQAHTKPILIVRDPKDALLSWCFMGHRHSLNIEAMGKFITSPIMLPPNKTTYANKMLMWKDHINGWLASLNNPLVIRYENLINAYATEAKKISDYLGVEVLSTKPELKEVKLSRNGTIGEHKLYFTQAMCEMIDEVCKSEIAIIDRYLI